MANSLQRTSGVDVDAVPETTVQESQAPAGSAGLALPMVGTNKVSQWATWDPNLWWTDWNLPADPRPSWERWFDWVNQLKALVPALGEASNDWQTMIGQFDNSLQTVRGMRADLADWTGPSATTMSAALDRLETSITTKTNAIRDNPAKLQELAQTINDAVPPMAALDAEYQQVLNDLVACRQVAERGRPIMLNLATKLLQTGTDLENSVQTDTLAPQPTPPQPVTLTDGPQGPGQQLTQVAGPSNLADPGAVASAAQIQVARQPGTAAASGLVDPGLVPTAQPAAMAHVPGVSISPAGPTVPTAPVSPADPTAPVAAASPTLAGSAAPPGTPTAPLGPTAAAAAAPAAMPAAPTVPTAMPAAPTAMPAASTAAMPAAVSAMATPDTPGHLAGTSGAVAVPAGLLGRAAGSGRATTETSGSPRDETVEPQDAGTGVVTARARRP